MAQVLAGSWFLVLASRRVSKSLDEEEAPAIPRRAVNFSESESEAPVSSTWGSPQVLESASTSDREAYFEVPILKHIMFGGPLMRHYLRSSWRWKKPHGRSLKIWKLGVLAFVIGNLSALRWIGNDPQHAPSSVLIFLMIASAMLIPIFVTASGGLSIARDRELGIWNHLRLSNIRSSEIALAKMLAPLIASVAYCVLLLGPLLVVTLWVFRGHTEPDSWRWREVSQLYLFAPICLLGTIQLSGWAAICSMRARRSSIALVASFAGALIFLFGVLIVFEVGFSSDGNYHAHRATQQLLGLLHPFYALGTASDLLNGNSSWSRPDLYIASLFSHSALAFAFYRAVVSHIARREK